MSYEPRPDLEEVAGQVLLTAFRDYMQWADVSDLMNGCGFSLTCDLDDQDWDKVADLIDTATFNATVGWSE